MITIQFYSGIVFGISTYKGDYEETDDSFTLDRTGNKNTILSIYLPFIEVLIIL